MYTISVIHSYLLSIQIKLKLLNITFDYPFTIQLKYNSFDNNYHFIILNLYTY